MPSQGSVPFLSRAKVPRYLLRGQPGASSATGKGHPCPELQLLWWLGRDTQPHLQTPNTLWARVSVTPRRKPQLGSHLGHFKWEQRQNEEEFGRNILGSIRG